MRKFWIAALLPFVAIAAVLWTLRVDSELILDCPRPGLVGVAKLERAAQDGPCPERQSISFASESTLDALRLTLLRHRGCSGPADLDATGEGWFDLGTKTVRLYVYADGALYRVVLDEWAAPG